MSSRGADLYLADIQEAIGRIRRYTSDLSFGEFAKDCKTIDAVVRNLSIIGEAAANIPGTVTAANPQIPWREIIGMRNKVIHEYFGVDEEVLWKTITEDLTALRGQITALQARDRER